MDSYRQNPSIMQIPISHIPDIKQTKTSHLYSPKLRANEESPMVQSSNSKRSPRLHQQSSLRKSVAPIFPMPINNSTTSHFQREAINIHSGPLAENITTFYNAEAVTIGKDIFFSQGNLDLSSPRGLSLFAHELTHIKQSQDDVNLRNGHTSSSKRASLEKEAQKIEQEALQYFANGNSYIAINQSTVIPSPYIRESPPRISLWNDTNITISPLFQSLLSQPFFLSAISDEKMIGINNSSEVLLPHIHQSITASGNLADNLVSTSFDPLQQADKTSTNRYASIQKLVFASQRTNQNVTATPSGNSTSIPFTAEKGRGVESRVTTSSPTPSPLPSQVGGLSLDVDGLAQRVYEIIHEKIKMQRNLIGFR